MSITETAVRSRDGTMLHVRVAGNPDGPAVLLLHGQASSSRVWEYLMTGPLVRRAYFIAPDYRGHGHSDKPRRGYRDTTTWAADISAVVAHLQLKQPILVGWSYGNAVACDYLRAGGTARGYVLVAGGSEANITDPQVRGTLAPEIRAVIRSRLRVSRRVFAEQIVDLFTWRPLDTAFRQRLVDDVLGVRPSAMIGVATRQYNNDDILTAFGAPILQIHGADDRIRLVHAAERRTALFRVGRTEIWLGCGHAPFLDYPDRFTETLGNFLGNLAHTATETR